MKIINLYSRVRKKFLIVFLSLFLVVFLCLFSFFKKIKIFPNETNNREITVYNWGEFMDTEVNSEFFKKTGIHVKYKTFQSNEEFFAKISAGNLDADVIIVSDYMISKLSNLGLLHKINYENIPNYILISDNFKNLNFDPNNEFSVPYAGGLVGIVYNSKFVSSEDLESDWNIFWNKKFFKKMLMFDNSRDAFGIALLKMNKNINTQDPDTLKMATEELKIQKNLISSYVMDQIFEKMASEEAWIAPYYAGDASTISKINPNVKFTIPKSGTIRFVDSMCILKNSKKAAISESYINFLCEPEISKKNVAKTNYSSPNLKLMDEKNSYDDAKNLKNSQCLESLNFETEILIDQLWTEIKIEKSKPILTLIILLILTFVYLFLRFDSKIFKLFRNRRNRIFNKNFMQYNKSN